MKGEDVFYSSCLLNPRISGKELLTPFVVSKNLSSTSLPNPHCLPPPSSGAIQECGPVCQRLLQRSLAWLV